jgi:prepilin signal peptidase PulO-like enzyme (type II secretory pathway)
MDFLLKISSFFIFFLGAIFGSFLNAQALRFLKPVSSKRSVCPRCGHSLSFLDLIPIFSYFLLLGRCRYCQKPISFQYLLMELMMGFVFLLSFLFFLDALNSNFWLGLFDLSYVLVIFSFLAVIFLVDFKKLIIPNKVVYPAILISLIYLILKTTFFSLRGQFINFDGFQYNFGNFLTSALVSSFFFALIHFISQGKWLGFGDVKLIFLMGLFLGFPKILAAIFIAFFSGAIIGLALILLKKKEIKSEIAFGPFLVFGTFLAFFWGEKIINWYLSFFSFQ